MNWRKLGLIFAPARQHAWLQTHASLPVALPLGGDRYRIYFASRDAENRSHVGYVDIDITAPKRLLKLSSEPVLAPGPLGFFDDHGVYPASIVQHDGRLHMYYVGWNPGARAPLFYSSIGLAVSEDGGLTFSKTSPAPVLARSEFDPCLVTSPFVMVDGGIWRMWYVSGFKWEVVDGTPQSFYHIKYAESHDGTRWKREGLVCIDLKPGEKNISRPCVLKDDGPYEMWYAYDGGCGYRIGYAESSDGYVWIRRDEDAGIGPSNEGWDAQALAYPWVFRHRGRLVMLYNGNAFGCDGFGGAICLDEGMPARAPSRTAKEDEQR